ncbi:MAG TPA: glycosyltransferase family 4 protein [Paludibacter sp.]
MDKKKIWIVTELFYPEETAVAYIFTRIANYLANSYQVKVICGPEFYDNNKIGFIDDLNILSGIEIFRTKSPNLNKNSLIQRTIKILIISLRMGFLMCRKIHKGEIVLLATNPAPLLLFVRIIQSYKKFQLHILVHDVFPENTIPARIFKDDKSIIFKSIKFLFDSAYSCADHLIVIGRDMKEIISTKVNNSKKPPSISVVTNWSNPEKASLETCNKNKTSKIILQYAGNIGRVQGIIELLDAFRLSNTEGICLNFRGTGALHSYIESYITKYNLENIHLDGGFSRNEENDILANCDIGIVSLSHGMYGLGVPSKSYHLLSAGKPILFIGEPKTEISLMVSENGIGWSLDVSNQNELIAFFNQLSSIDSGILIEMGTKARELANIRYNEQTILKLLQIEIESIKHK